MAKKKSKQKRSKQHAGKPADASPPTTSEWDSVEVEFFAREAELYRVSAVETFDDLDKD